jgi:hypothetical protein
MFFLKYQFFWVRILNYLDYKYLSQLQMIQIYCLWERFIPKIFLLFFLIQFYSSIQLNLISNKLFNSFQQNSLLHCKQNLFVFGNPLPMLIQNINSLSTFKYSLYILILYLVDIIAIMFLSWLLNFNPNIHLLFLKILV